MKGKILMADLLVLRWYFSINSELPTLFPAQTRGRLRFSPRSLHLTRDYLVVYQQSVLGYGL
jgi:hypothetical protein